MKRGEHQHYRVTETPVYFYDDGGKEGNRSLGPFFGTAKYWVTFYPSSPEMVVQIDFNKVDLYDDYAATYDLLEVYNADTIDKSSVAMSRYEKDKPYTVVADDATGALTVFFSPTSYLGAGNRAGWEATVKSVPRAGQAAPRALNITAGHGAYMVTENPTSFYDDGGKDGPRQNGGYRWLITFKPTTPGRIVELDFTQIDLYDDKAAVYDELWVYDGKSSSGDLLDHRFTKPRKFAAKGETGAISVAFRSTTLKGALANKRAGWEATVREVERPMAYLGTTVSPVSTEPVSAGASTVPMLGINIRTQYHVAPLKLSAINFTTSGTFAQIRKAALYTTGAGISFNADTRIGEVEVDSDGFAIALDSPAPLSEGNNYFWLAYDVKSSVPSGSTLAATCASIKISGNEEAIPDGSPECARSILPVLYSVTRKPTEHGAYRALLDDDSELPSQVEAGTRFRVENTPDENWELDSVMVAGAEHDDTHYVVRGDVTISVTFREKNKPQPSEFTLTIAPSEHGTLTVNSEDGSSLTNGAKITKGQKLKVNPLPEKGYQLGELRVDGAEQAEGFWVVQRDVTASATFISTTPEFAVNWEVAEGLGSIRVTTSDGQELTNGGKVKKSTLLKVELFPQAGYWVNQDSVKVTGAEHDGEYWRVTADVRISVKFSKDKPKESGKSRVFITINGGGTCTITTEDGQRVENQTDWDKGTKVKIKVAPDEGYTYNDHDDFHQTGMVANNDFYRLAGDEVKIEVTFHQRLCQISVAHCEHGKLSVTCENSHYEISDSTLRYGTRLRVEALPEEYYELRPDSLKVTGAERVDDLWRVVDDEVLFSATFTRQEAGLTVEVTGAGTCTVTTKSGRIVPSGSRVKIGELLTITANPEAHHKLAGLTVEGAAPEGSKYKVASAVTVRATFSEDEKPQPATEFTLTVAVGEGGICPVLRENGDTVRSGDKLPGKTLLKIVPRPNNGYLLADNGLAVTGASKQPDGLWMVQGDVNIAVTFSKRPPEPTPDAVVPEVATLQIAPNPFAGKIQISGVSACIRYRLLSSTGLLLESGVLRPENPVIDTENVPVGLYILWLEHGGHSRSIRLVKP